jgi:hypothetical protein
MANTSYSVSTDLLFGQKTKFFISECIKYGFEKYNIEKNFFKGSFPLISITG